MGRLVTWRNSKGERCLSLNEGGVEGPFVLVVFLSPNFGLRFLYIAVRAFGKWRRFSI